MENSQGGGSQILAKGGSASIIIALLIVAFFGYESLFGGCGSKEYQYKKVDDVNSKLIDQKQCQRAGGEFKNFIINAAKEFSTPQLPISPQIIAAILSRESHMGYLLSGASTEGGCDGKGDNNRGFGIAQMDISNTQGRDYIEEFGKKYRWKDCQESISFLAAHLKNKNNPKNRKDVISAMNKAGMSTIQTDPNDSDSGFVSINSTKVYLQFMVNFYNAGSISGIMGTCSISLASTNYVVNDACTTGRDYSNDILNRAKLLAKCMGLADDENSIVNPNNYEKAVDDVNSTPARDCDRRKILGWDF